MRELLATAILAALTAFSMALPAYTCSTSQNFQNIRTIQLSSPIITNLLQAPDGTQHIVRLEAGLGINNTDPAAADEFIESLMQREIIILDRINNTLRRTTAEEISKPDGMELLAQEILTSLQDAFNTNLIVDVYIVQIIIQEGNVAR